MNHLLEFSCLNELRSIDNFDNEEYSGDKQKENDEEYKNGIFGVLTRLSSLLTVQIIYERELLASTAENSPIPPGWNLVTKRGCFSFSYELNRLAHSIEHEK
jgi:hypothetical protein